MLPQFTAGHIFIAWQHFRTSLGPLGSTYAVTHVTQEIWPYSSNTFFLPPFSHWLPPRSDGLPLWLKNGDK